MAEPNPHVPAVTVRMSTTRGRVRERNEDHAGLRAGDQHLEVADEDQTVGVDSAAVPVLVVVADGLGGHPGGDVASRSATRSVLKTAPLTASGLVDAVLRAHDTLREEMDDTTSGMGTTIAAVLVHEAGVAVVNVGDSPVFALEHQASPPQLVQLSVDDVPTGETTRSGMITQSLGGFEPLIEEDVHLRDEPLPAPVRLLVCSDGLSGFVPGEVISLVLDSVTEPEDAVQTLLDLADAAGGLDNCTVAVIDIHDHTALEPSG